jgi:predicted nucleic acid-binding protein
MTQNSFLRLLSSKAICREAALSNERAIHAYRSLQTDSRVGWMDEPAGLESVWLSVASAKSPSPARWMDAYLSACAILHKCRLVTFDQGFKQYQSMGLDLLLLATEAE